MAEIYILQSPNMAPMIGISADPDEMPHVVASHLGSSLFADTQFMGF